MSPNPETLPGKNGWRRSNDDFTIARLLSNEIASARIFHQSSLGNEGIVVETKRGDDCCQTVTE